MIQAPNFADLDWLIHGFGLRGSRYPDEIVTVKQVHSNTVLDASDWTGGPEPVAEGDALLSGRPGMLVGVRTADCVPILLVDTAKRAVAAIHAGWRGTAQGIAGATVRAMAGRWGSQPEDLRAAIGPSIGGCCYEVGPEVAHRFGIETSKSVCLDLRTDNERQLVDASVINVWKSGECTFCASGRFFSFRRERGEAGRMISFIGIRAEPR